VLVFNYKTPFSVVRSRYLRNFIRPNGSFSCEYPNLVRSPIWKSPLIEGTKTEAHPKVVRALRLVDEEESEVEKPVEATPAPTPRTEAPANMQGVKEPHEGAPKETAQDRVSAEESDVEVVEAPLIKRKKLERASEPTTLEVNPVMFVAETTAPAVNVVQVAGFLAACRSQAPPPSVPRVEEVIAFIANEPIPAIPMNVAGLVDEPLVAPKGPIPSVLNRQLGSNIQYILEDLEMASEDSVGMADENLGPFVATTEHVPQGPLFTISEAGASSRAPMPKRSRSPTHVEKTSASKRPHVFEVPEASEASESTVEI
jgi:hypothetical protein